MKLSDLLIYTGEVPLKIIIWSIYIGVVIAVIASFVTKSNFGKFVSALIEKNASTPENALKPDETGVKMNIFIKAALKNHMHYNNFLVAITPDGKFYANYTYCESEPVLKEYKAIIRKSKIKKSTKDEAEDNPITEETIAEDNPVTEETISETKSEPITFTDKKERIKFDPSQARYYLPKEVQSKAESVYGYKKTNIAYVILGLVAFAVVAYFSEFIIEGLQDMFGNIGK